MRKKLRAIRSHFHSAILASSLIPIVVLVGCCLSLAGFFSGRYREDNPIRAQFDAAADNRISALRRELKAEWSEISLIRAICSRKGKFDPEQFARLGSLPRQSETSSDVYQWIPRVPHRQKSRFEGEQSARVRSGYRIWERSAGGGSISARPRDDYYPVQFSLPAGAQAPMLGLDVASAPQLRKVLELARDTGNPAVTAPIRQTQNAQRPVVSLFTPVYSSNAVPATTLARRQQLLGLLWSTLRPESCWSAACAI